jgi:flagellar biosynthesis protein FlhF
MQTKRFVAADMRRALALVRDELGDDAMILSTQRTGKGVEIIATLEDQAMPAKPTAASPVPPVRQTVTEANRIGPASGKTQEELALELEMARRRMLAVQQQENMTIGEWADRQPAARQRPSSTKPFSSNPQPAVANAAALTASREVAEESQQIRQLQDEIASMRSLFQQQLTLMAEAQERQYQDQQATQAIIPIASEIKKRLEQLGLTRACNDQVIRSLRSIDDSSMNEATLWVESLARLARKIPAITNDPVATGGIYAFLGTTGVGKTTTIAKLAARHVMEHGPDQVALLTTDTFRIAAHDQLRSLGRILNVHVKVVDNLQDLPQILAGFSKQTLVLIDTPGMGYNDPLLKDHLTALSRCRHVQNCLVLSANSQYQMMQASLHSYRIANPRFCVMTKLDECASLGDAISLLTANDLALAYITNGQSVPDDLAVIKPHQLVSKAVALSKMADQLKTQPSQSV